MYEPHWSAINRFLEMSEEGSGSDKFSNIDVGSSSNHNRQQYQSSDMTQLSNLSNLLGSDTIFPPYSDSPTSLPSQNSAARRVPVIPGAIPNNWAHLEEESKPKHKHETGAGTVSSISGPSITTKKAVDGSEGAAGVGSGVGRDGGNEEKEDKGKVNAQQSGTVGTTSTTKSPNPKYGVTKEDLQRSAKRIYCKYLTSQAENPIRIPGSVRDRVAQLMDGLMLVNSSDGGKFSRGTTGVPPITGTTSSMSTPETFSRRKNGLGNHPENATAAHSSMISLSSPKNEKFAQQKGSNINTNNKHKRGPQQITMSQSSAYQPDQELGLIFAEAREIVFEGMESYYFPRFLRTRAYGNMMHPHRVARVVLGLFILFIGFVIVLCMIFLNLQPRSLRAWALIPMFLGILLCTTFQFNICPLMATFGVSETNLMKFVRIKEPYILILHRKRAIKVVVVAILYTMCVGIVFGLVPGHRL
ncbi:Bud site selection protein, Revert to axial protein 1 [Haplosporangium sp. Z 27]|nr:Bud site selection protein, Revert to axial protein 1 [Haplosporangium sp. Z 27]